MLFFLTLLSPRPVPVSVGRVPATVIRDETVRPQSAGGAALHKQFESIEAAGKCAVPDGNPYTVTRIFVVGTILVVPKLDAIQPSFSSVVAARKRLDAAPSLTRSSTEQARATSNKASSGRRVKAIV